MNRVNFKRFPFTYGLIGISLIVFIYTTIRYGLDMDAYEAINAGAFNPYFVQDLHQYWRLITANFLHFGLLHLVLNLYSLHNIGPFVESQFKRYEYFIIIVTSMIFTNLLGIVIYLSTGTGAGIVSGGISGVIFGLLGSIVVLGLVYRGFYARVMKSLMPSIIIMMFLSITISTISLTGHLGGMIGGAISTYYIIYMRKKNYN